MTGTCRVKRGRLAWLTMISVSGLVLHCVRRPTLEGTYRVSYGIRPCSIYILLDTQEHVRAFRACRQKPHPCATVRPCFLIGQRTSSMSINPLAKGF